MADPIIAPVIPVTKVSDSLKKRHKPVKKPPPEEPKPTPDQPNKKGGVDTYA